jgi:hypothetical protein
MFGCLCLCLDFLFNRLTDTVEDEFVDAGTCVWVARQPANNAGLVFSFILRGPDIDHLCNGEINFSSCFISHRISINAGIGRKNPPPSKFAYRFRTEFQAAGSTSGQMAVKLLTSRAGRPLPQEDS